MNDMRRINIKLKKLYRPLTDNIYSNRFLTDLFTGYEYSLSRNNKDDFFRVTPNDKEIISLFTPNITYNFSYEFGQIIDRILLSMATYGKSYIIIKPDYIEGNDKKGKVNQVIGTLSIAEVKGVLKGNTFYYKFFDGKIHEFKIHEGTLITFDLKEVGYKRNYFVKIAKKLEKHEIISESWFSIKNDPNYDFDVHLYNSKIKTLKLVKDLGWYFETENLSGSYILFKEIQMKLFKIKMLDYVLEKINKALIDKYIDSKDFKIEASIDNLNYEDTREKFQTGEITKSELSKIVWG